MRQENGQTAAPDRTATSLILFLQHFLSSPVLGKVQTKIEGKREKDSQEKNPNTTDDNIGQTCDQCKVCKVYKHTIKKIDMANGKQSIITGPRYGKNRLTDKISCENASLSGTLNLVIRYTGSGTNMIVVRLCPLLHDSYH